MFTSKKTRATDLLQLLHSAKCTIPFRKMHHSIPQNAPLETRKMHHSRPALCREQYQRLHTKDYRQRLQTKKQEEKPQVHTHLTKCLLLLIVHRLMDWMKSVWFSPSIQRNSRQQVTDAEHYTLSAERCTSHRQANRGTGNAPGNSVPHLLGSG